MLYYVTQNLWVLCTKVTFPHLKASSYVVTDRLVLACPSCDLLLSRRSTVLESFILVYFCIYKPTAQCGKFIHISITETGPNHWRKSSWYLQMETYRWSANFCSTIAQHHQRGQFALETHRAFRKPGKISKCCLVFLFLAFSIHLRISNYSFLSLINY